MSRKELDANRVMPGVGASRSGCSPGIGLDWGFQPRRRHGFLCGNSLCKDKRRRKRKTRWVQPGSWDRVEVGVAE